MVATGLLPAVYIGSIQAIRQVFNGEETLSKVTVGGAAYC